MKDSMDDEKPVLSQVPVLVTIVGVDSYSEVYYTYTNPDTGIHFDKSRTCLIHAVSPYQTLFALDYATSRNGWTIIQRAAPKPETPPSISPITPPLIHSVPDPKVHGLVLITLDSTDLEYKFDLSFFNRITKQPAWDDPQEGNVLRPVKPGGAP